MATFRGSPRQAWLRLNVDEDIGHPVQFILQGNTGRGGDVVRLPDREIGIYFEVEIHMVT
jgi:hypothetical protein